MIGLVLLDVGDVRSHYPDGLKQLDVVDEADELVVTPEGALPNEDHGGSETTLDEEYDDAGVHEVFADVQMMGLQGL